jgi:hypothetical protein
MENFNSQLIQFLSQPGLVLPLILWSVFWKGWALWKSANKRHLVWFVVLLLVNTLGLLEIAYIFYLNKWDIDNGKILAFIEKRFGKPKKS